jgi:hypothetical protein
MQIDESAVQPEKAESPIRASRMPGSNATAERDVQSQKHEVESFSTEAGMQIEESDVHDRNA